MSLKMKNYTIIAIVLIINMAVMISDYKAICNIVGAACSVLIIGVILYSKRFVISFSPVIKCIFFFTLYYILTSLIKGSLDAVLTSVLYFNIEFTCIYLIEYLTNDNHYSYNDERFDRTIVKWFFIIWDVFCVIAIVYYNMIPDLARQMAAYRASYVNLIIGGGYPMAYGSVVLGVFLFQILIEKKVSGKLVLPVIAEIVLLTILVYFTNSFICMIAMLFGWIICYIRSKITGSTFIIIAIIVGVFGIVIYVNIDAILTGILALVKNEFIHERIQELYESIVLDQTSFHLNKRSSLYQMSFQSFCEHPLFGVGYTYGNDGALNRLNGVGSHSTILNTLGQYGIIGSIPMFGILLYPIKKAVELGESPFYLFSFFVMLALNPSFSTYHLVLIAYLIIPLIIRLINKEKL